VGKTKQQLLVLTSNNDPFNAGTPAEDEAAKWFTRVYEEVGYKGIHLRRLHYRAYDAGVLNQEGEQYPNTHKQWTNLQVGSRIARHLGYVDYDDFRDMKVRGPAVESVSGWLEIPEPSYEVRDAVWFEWSLPTITTDLSGSVEPEAEFEVHGYHYFDQSQPNLIEVWAEKSGDDDTLAPLARELGINYHPGVGFQSISNIRGMFRRIRDAGKPTRILYVSDFDPAGMGMPIQVGRHTQFAFWRLEQLAEEETPPNVKLEAIALTHAQVAAWKIPRKPMADDKPGKDYWEERFGEGAVEIDALEARFPGRLARLVREKVEALQDTTLERRISAARGEAESRVARAVQEVIEHHRAQAQVVVEEFDEIAQHYRDRLEALSAEFEGEVSHLRERLREQHHAFRSELESLEVELPEMPEGVPPEDEEADGWMFDSDRGFDAQTMEFRRRQKR
jgi:hypothetical protein